MLSTPVVVDRLGDDPSYRDLVAELIEYRRAFGECAASLDFLRNLQDSP